MANRIKSAAVAHNAGVSRLPTIDIPGLGGLPHGSVNNHSIQPLSTTTPSNTPDPRSRQQKLQPTRQDTDLSRSVTPTNPATPDASSITTWPAAVKHVTKYIVADEQASSRIKHLVNEQHKHEEQWWRQRQEIVTRHAGRAGNQAIVTDILKELGGLAGPVAKVDEAADKNELETFDKKVYQSLTQMTQDFDRQLKKLGVPFFAIKHDLILLDGGKDGSGSTVGKLDKGELRELQKRMLQILEDLLIDG
ncbi:hypothetical protein LTR05_007632 [Lithohypha guttulata]|uniref:Uncharacterized protein n=1 Tax=Lithohypha guttulata TaxID=1690604 RepID=A0AAN7SU38_9EURO|nr:hypothetical protein LTR05_007632 [Lithohypha guttulata]